MDPPSSPGSGGSLASFDDDDLAERVPTARYVEGRAGLAHGRLKKIALSRASFWEGDLVIELDSANGRAGTLRFYTESVLEKLSAFRPRALAASGHKKLGGRTNPLLTERRNSPVMESRRGSRGSPLLGSRKKRASFDGVNVCLTDITVKAGMEPYKEPYVEPHLLIPGVRESQ